MKLNFKIDIKNPFAKKADLSNIEDLRPKKVRFENAPNLHVTIPHSPISLFQKPNNKDIEVRTEKSVGKHIDNPNHYKKDQVSLDPVTFKVKMTPLTPPPPPPRPILPARPRANAISSIDTNLLSPKDSSVIDLTSNETSSSSSSKSAF